MGKIHLLGQIEKRQASRADIASTLQRSVLIVQNQRAIIASLESQIRDLGAEPDQQFLNKKFAKEQNIVDSPEVPN